MVVRWVGKAARRVAPSLGARYDLLTYVEQYVVSRTDGDEYVPEMRRCLPAIDLAEDDQVARIASWSRWAPLFGELRRDRTINTSHESFDDRIHNGYFPTPDAEAYAAMIGDLRPRAIIEVGGGFSTLIARRAIEWFQLDCQLVVVDPEPRTQVAHAADMLVASRAEDCLSEVMTDLPPALLLFIDSSHVVRTGGDVTFLYGEVVPTLAPGSVVHAHDIFTPFDYPSGATRRLWTEQYLVEALLSSSPRYEILLTTHCLSRCHTRAMRRAFGEAVAVNRLHFGGSLWFRVRPSAGTHQ
jgi:hypothetical protein